MSIQASLFIQLVLLDDCGSVLSDTVLNKVIQNSTARNLEYFVLMILAGSLFYQVMFYLNLTHSIDMSFFICPVSFVVLGYYLSVKEFDISTNKLITIAFLYF